MPALLDGGEVRGEALAGCEEGGGIFMVARPSSMPPTVHLQQLKDGGGGSVV